jgi:hypothetical protein
MNSHIDKLFEKRRRVGYFIIVGVVVRKDDGHERVVKRNDSGKWSSDGIVLWLGGGKMEMWLNDGEIDQG